MREREAKKEKKSKRDNEREGKRVWVCKSARRGREECVCACV